MSCCNKCGKCGGLPIPELPWEHLGPPYPSHLVIMGIDIKHLHKWMQEIPRITIISPSVSDLLPLAAVIGSRENIELVAAIADPLVANSADWVCITDTGQWEPHWLERVSKWLRPGGQVMMAGQFSIGHSDQSSLNQLDWEAWKQSCILAGLNPNLIDKTIVQELYTDDGTLDYSLFQAIVRATKEG